MSTVDQQVSYFSSVHKMDKLDYLQETVVKYLAVSNSTTADTKNYRRKGDKRSIFFSDAQRREVQTNALRSVIRSLKAHRNGSDKSSYQSLSSNFNIFEFIEPIPGQRETLLPFDHDLYLSQFPTKMGRQQSKPTDTRDSIDPDSPESQSNWKVVQTSSTHTSFGTMSEVRGPGRKDGIDYSFAIKMQLDDTMCGSSGAPFYLQAMFCPRGAKKQGVAHDVLILTVPILTPGSLDLSLTKPLQVSPSGTRCYVTIPSCKQDQLELADLELEALIGLDRIGSQIGSITDAIGSSKNSIKLHAPDSYVLMIELPDDIKVHTKDFQDEEIKALGANLASAEILHSTSVRKQKTLQMNLKGSVQGWVFVMPIVGRAGIVDELEQNPMARVAARQRMLMQQKNKASIGDDDLVDGVKGCSLTDDNDLDTHGKSPTS